MHEEYPSPEIEYSFKSIHRDLSDLEAYINVKVTLMRRRILEIQKKIVKSENPVVKARTLGDTSAKMREVRDEVLEALARLEQMDIE